MIRFVVLSTNPCRQPVILQAVRVVLESQCQESAVNILPDQLSSQASVTSKTGRPVSDQLQDSQG